MQQKKFYFKINHYSLGGTNDLIYNVDNLPLQPGEIGVGPYATFWARNESEACKKKEENYGDKPYITMDSFYFTTEDPIGEYLIYTELNPNSIIMVENIDGTKEPYYIDQIKTGTLSQATMLLGQKLSKLMKYPGLYPCSRLFGNDKYYIPNGNVKKQNQGVKGYRFLKQIEKNEWLNKIKPVEKLEALQSLLA